VLNLTPETIISFSIRASTRLEKDLSVIGSDFNEKRRDNTLDVSIFSNIGFYASVVSWGYYSSFSMVASSSAAAAWLHSPA
jgi:hypothetical protein